MESDRNNLMQPQLIRELVALLGPNAVLSQAEDLMLYEYDGSVELGSPECIVFPSSTREVAEIVRLANRYETPLVGRGAGTGLSGGAIARDGGIVIAFSRMNRILEIDAANLRAVSNIWAVFSRPILRARNRVRSAVTFLKIPAVRTRLRTE